MQISVAWLNEWLQQPVEAQALAGQLTMAGLEVDAVLPAAAAFSGVVVGEILECGKHPEADRLSVCRVSDGSTTFQVVCGAPNAAAGLKVPFAKTGAQLPDGTQIRKAKLRGVESEGMLCGASELGLEDRTDGLFVLPADAPVGRDLRDYLQLDDRLLELDLTPNRGDCLGVLGLAREVAALAGSALRCPEFTPVPATIPDTPAVAVEAAAACPRYAARIIRGIDISRPAPLWLRERLRRAGIRSIDAVVDVTNYVMLELGQPMHAFDLARVAGGIRVRMAQAGESLVLLDGSNKQLSADALVIADHQQPLALAGIMGGEASGVGTATQDILLESAFFDPVALAGKARHYGLHTDSSHRFERGVDPSGQVRAIERATCLLLGITGGQPGPVLDVGSGPQAVPAVTLRREAISAVLGLALPDATVTGILDRLGCQCTAAAAGWQVAVPAWRFDISREVDLIEELARVYGYNHLPVAAPSLRMQLQALPEARVTDDRYRDLLVDRGYREAITYSFVDPALQQQVMGQAAAVQVQNPIASDMAAMRLSLWPGLLKAAVANLDRQQQRVRLFELGLVFQGVAAEAQVRRIAGVSCGPAQAAHWSGKGRAADFFDIKGDAEALLAIAGAGREIAFRRASHAALHPGQAAEVLLDGQPVGWLGALHPLVQQQLGLAGTPYLFELCLDTIADGKLPSFKELSRFPETRRDLALVLDRTIPASEVAADIRQRAGGLLKTLEVFDQFEGPELGHDKKSLGFGLVFQHGGRTLTDDEVNAVVHTVVTGVTARFGALVRN